MNGEIIRLQHEITTFIAKDNGATVHFDVEHTKPLLHDNNVTVNAYTLNPNSNETFLLKSATDKSVVKAFEQILDYVKSLHGLNSFTVKWKKNGDTGEMNTSYFYCHDVVDVVKKFFTGKEVVDYTIYEIILNHIS